MKHIDKLRDMLCDELDEITAKGKLTVDSLDAIDMITHSIKSIDTILAMEEAEYNRGYSGRRYYDHSYGRGRSARRDNMGRRTDGHMTDEYME